ncbi:ATP-binding protein, partial [Leptothoe spongobia]
FLRNWAILVNLYVLLSHLRRVQDLSLSALLQSIVEICQIQAEQKGIGFQYTFDETLPTGIITDDKRLRQVLLNLLSNAIKFTDNGQVTLRVNQEEEEGDDDTACKLNFSVEDTGIGISPEQSQQIFAPFEQVGQQQKRSEGTGLGLAISQQIVTLMGGTIQLQSQVGQGSTFDFTIPITPCSSYSAANSVKPHQAITGYDGPPRHILVVDDRWENRDVLTNLLADIGFEVTEAIHGQDALDKLDQCRPDAIITDLIMPVMDGFTLIKQLRQLDAWQTLPIIASSASVSAVDEQNSLLAGSNEFLPKPVQADSLFKVLQAHLNLTWLYAATIPASDLESTTINLHFPPEDILQSLHHLALQGNLKKIKQQVKQLTETDPTYTAFAQQIQMFVTDFQEQELTQFLKDAIANGQTE